jgi:hypothetical protein
MRNEFRRGACEVPFLYGQSITEAVEVGYLYGGTAALVMGANAFHE